MNSTEEYIPAETEPTALILDDSAAVAPTAELIRIQCAGCTKEQGMTGTREQAFKLLEWLGWRIGREILCPACVTKTARKFLKRYQE